MLGMNILAFYQFDIEKSIVKKTFMKKEKVWIFENLGIYWTLGNLRALGTLRLWELLELWELWKLWELKESQEFTIGSGSQKM